MEFGTRHRIWRGAIAAFAIAALIVVGSLIYWLADGRGGTSDDFRQRVADSGLSVVWSNSGPRGGSGSVETSCGPVAVTVDEIDDELWIRWAGHHGLATPETIAALLSCADGG
jgi:hypothetical protein